MIKSFLIQNYASIIILLIVMISALIRTKNKPVKEKILALFLEAEKLNITGPERMKWVANVVFSKMKIGKEFISEEQVADYLQQIYNDTKSSIANYKK